MLQGKGRAVGSPGHLLWSILGSWQFPLGMPIAQEVKGGVTLVSLSHSLGPVALPLFLPETCLPSGSQNSNTYCELFRVI